MRTENGCCQQRKARAFAVAAGLGGLLAIRSVLPAGTPRVRGRAGIATLEKVRLGDSSQWVLERSEDTANPIILFLHGGPGTSQLTSNRRNTRDLEKYFTVVNWDQRGAGKSYRAIRDADRMNIDQFVADTRDLTLFLLAKFGQQRLILAGHSWGSVIAALTVSRYPELYHCYVGIGQMADMAEGEAASYRWTLEQARKHRDGRAIRALERMGPPPYQGDWQRKTITERGYVAHFGGEIHASRYGAAGLVLRGLLWSREYTLADRVNYFRGILGSMRLLWPELLRVDLSESVPEFKVPVFFVEGRYDRECPCEVAERYFESVTAPSKELIWFDRSAHLPNSEERDQFNRLMVTKVRPLATTRLATTGPAA